MLIDLAPNKSKQPQSQTKNAPNQLKNQTSLFLKKKLKENCESLKKTKKFSLYLRKKSIHKTKESYLHSEKTSNTIKTLSKPNMKTFGAQLDSEETVINAIHIKKEGLKNDQELKNINVHFLEQILETYQKSVIMLIYFPIKLIFCIAF